MSDPFKLPDGVLPKKLGVLAPTPALIKFRHSGSARFSHDLGVIPPDEGWEIHTVLDQERMQGVANRNIPMPYFMKNAKRIDEMAKPGQPMRALLVLGEPATGKTYNLMATAEKYGAPLFFSCEGKRGEELFKQVRFSYSEEEHLEDRVNAILGEINCGKRKMQPLSLAALRQLGDAFHEESGKYAIDWPMVAHNGAPREDGVSRDKTSYEGVFTAIEKFMQAQGVAIDQKQMDIKYEDGPIITAIKEKRPFVLLDEFTRMDDYNGLLDIMEVFMGLKPSSPLLDADGKEVPCKKGELPILLMTGNNLNDVGVTKMPKPLRSRLKIMQVELPEDETEKLMNWQHVIETLISGLPLNTLIKASYGSNAGNAKQEADQLREFFVEYFNFAMTEEERRLHPKWKQSMQLNWENVTEASEQLAKFFVGLKQYFDPKSTIYVPQSFNQEDVAVGGHAARILAERGGQVNAQNQTPMQEMIKSALHHVKEPIQIDFRSFAVAVMEAATHKERAVSGDHYGPWFLRHEGHPGAEMKSLERLPIEQKFGEQLVSAIVEWRDELLKNIDDPDARAGLRKLTDQHMANCRLIDQAPGQAIHRLGPVAGPKRVDELLTIDPDKHRTVSDEAQLLRETVIAKIKKKHPAMADEIPDDFMSASSIEGLLRDIARNENGPKKELLALNVPGNSGSATAPDLSRPFARMVSYDAADREVKSIIEAAKRKPGILPDAETILESLTLPGRGRKNFQALWSQELSKAGIGDRNDPAIEVAEDRSRTGLALTTRTCRNKEGKLCSLQVWHNRNNNTTLIVGDAIDPELKAALEAPKTGLGITYVDRHSPDAEKEARQVIAHILEGDDRINTRRSLLLKAFSFRHKITAWDDHRELNEKEIGHIGTARIAVNDGTASYRLRHDDPIMHSAIIETVIPNIIMSKSIQK